MPSTLDEKFSVNFEQLVHEYLGPVFGFLMTLVRDRDTAEDLAQETFLRAWKKRQSLDTSKNVKAWLFTVAKNVALDSFKKKKELPFVLFETESHENHLEDIPDAMLLPDELLIQAEGRGDVEKTLAMLSPRDQALLLLVYRDELSLSEAAAVFGVPYNTLKSQHRRALLALKTALIEHVAPN